MDVEKLIRRLRNDADAYRNGETLGRAFADQEDVLDNAATALSTLQAENERFRKELEYEREHANAYHEECGQWEAENEKLRETVDKYATAARVIALHLKPFCDESLPYDKMIADAARKASDELEQVKWERDSAILFAQCYTEKVENPCTVCRHRFSEAGVPLKKRCENCGLTGTPECGWEFDFDWDLKSEED